MHVRSVALSIFLICVASVSVGCAEKRTTLWTEFRRTPSNNAVVGGRLETRWQTATDGRISSSPTFTRGKVFVGTNAGTLYALRVTDGRVIWKHHVDNPLMSAPLLYRGLVIAGEGNSNTPTPKGGAPAHVGTGHSALIAFDQNTGVIRWISRLQGSGMPTPAVVDGILVHHDGSGNITGMDPTSGRMLYERDLHSVASMSAAVPVSARSFVTSGALYNAVWKIDARSGRVEWRSSAFPPKASGVGDCPMASDGTRVYGEYVVQDGISNASPVGKKAREHVYALAAQTGALLWDVPLQDGPLPINNEAGVPVLHDGILYAGVATAPWVNALDVRTGRVLWRKKIYAPVKSAFVVKNGTLYFGDLSGNLWALNASNGSRIGMQAFPTSFNVGSGIAVGQTFIIGSFTGLVYAIPLQAIRTSR